MVIKPIEAIRYLKHFFSPTSHGLKWYGYPDLYHNTLQNNDIIENIHRSDGQIYQK
jgi:hypothetical protein